MSPHKTRTRYTIGRPRVVGLRLPSLEQVLQDPETRWQKLTLDWYDEGVQTLEICTCTALWYRYGYDPLPIRWVLTRDSSGQRPPEAIFSTDSTQTAEQIIGDEISHWRLEVTFEESRAYVGIETQRQWSDLAIERSTPLLFGLYSLVTLFGRALHPDGQIPVTQAAWSRKQTSTGYLDHPFKNKRVQTEKDLHSLLANTGWSVYYQMSSTADSCSNKAIFT